MTSELSEAEAWKQSELERLLAKGYTRDELTWWPPCDLPEQDPPTHYANTNEPISEAGRERSRKNFKDFREKRRRGMWTVNWRGLRRKVES